MSSSDVVWSELSSQNERVIQGSDAGLDWTDVGTGSARAQWAALASQTERLADVSDPQFGLASSSHSTSGMRLVASPAA
jgi:hypothetical protein